MEMNVTYLINYLTLEGLFDRIFYPPLVKRIPRPWGMSLPMREKLLIRGRTPRRNSVRRRNLWKKETLKRNLWRKKTRRKSLCRRKP